MKMKKQQLYFDWLVHYCLLILEMATIWKDIVDNKIAHEKIIFQLQGIEKLGHSIICAMLLWFELA